MFKSRKSTSLLVFVILLLISFVGLTVTANLLGNTQKFDLTDNKRFSLSPASKKILSELTAPVYVRVYLSNNLVKENPQYSAYASFVLRYLKKYQQAAEYFGKLGALKDNDEWLEAAGAYWAFRANMKLNRKQKAEQELKTAAKYSRTFYGMLAAYALGQKIEYNWDETPFWNDFSNPQYAAGLVESPYIRRAVALYHAKQPELADQEIENGYAEMTEKQKEAVLFLLKQNNRHRMAIKVSNDLRDDEKNITYFVIYNTVYRRCNCYVKRI